MDQNVEKVGDPIVYRVTTDQKNLETQTSYFNTDTVERGVRMILQGLGYQIVGGLKDTPRRVAEMYRQLVVPEEFTPTLFDLKPEFNDRESGMIIVKDIWFYSLCEHHLIPFFGTAHIGYIPRRKIIGLSKIARAVELYARRLQVQERLTEQIADWIQVTLDPLGVAVILHARHLCMEQRGVQKPGTQTITSAMLGRFFDNLSTREEFLKLITT